MEKQTLHTVFRDDEDSSRNESELSFTRNRHGEEVKNSIEYIDDPFRIETTEKSRRERGPSIKSQNVMKRDREVEISDEDLNSVDSPSSSEDIAMGIAVPSKEELEEQERTKKELIKLAEPIWLCD